MSKLRFAAFGVGAFALYAGIIRPWHLRWGATEAEKKKRLPGDDRVPQPKGEATHAITIHAPVEDVWPWLVQIGQDRAGFYSYSWLENIVGCHLHNADRIVPEWQHLRVGDAVRLHPKVPPLPVLICEPNQALVLGSNTSHPGTWGFFLERLDSKTTRLVVRGREEWSSPLYSLFYRTIFEPTHFLMERKMLVSLKEKAEHSIKQVRLTKNERPCRCSGKCQQQNCLAAAMTKTKSSLPAVSVT